MRRTHECENFVSQFSLNPFSYQQSGELLFEKTTNGQYHIATIAAFQAAGFDQETALNLASRARAQRLLDELKNVMEVPRGPGVKCLQEPTP